MKKIRQLKKMLLNKESNTENSKKRNNDNEIIQQLEYNRQYMATSIKSKKPNV